MKRDRVLTLNFAVVLAVVCTAAGLLCGLATAKDRARPVRLIDGTHPTDIITVVDPNGDLVEIDGQAIKDAIDEQQLTFTNTDLHQKLYVAAFERFMQLQLNDAQSAAFFAGLWATTATAHYEATFSPVAVSPPTSPDGGRDTASTAIHD